MLWICFVGNVLFYGKKKHFSVPFSIANPICPNFSKFILVFLNAFSQLSIDLHLLLMKEVSESLH